jgi:hypothetical protein
MIVVKKTASKETYLVRCPVFRVGRFIESCSLNEASYYKCKGSSNMAMLG